MHRFKVYLTFTLVLILHTSWGSIPHASADGLPESELQKRLSALDDLRSAALQSTQTLASPEALRLLNIDTPPLGGAIEEHPKSGASNPNPLGWGPWQGPIDLFVASQLANRGIIGATYEEIQHLQSLGLEGAVDYLLAPEPLPEPPGDWVFEPLPDFRNLTPAEQDAIIEEYRYRGEYLRVWWAEHIIENQVGLTETMTHFWHDHFSTELQVVFIPQSIYKQNDLFRRNALGNFRELVREVSKDPAMLIYLNGNLNRVGNPNENYARELLELFTMGEESPYTQTDVEEVARACTGYVTDGLNTFFLPAYHDYLTKTVLGQTGSWNLDDVIDIIFEQEETAEFICRKLYHWFVDDNPSESDIQNLAGILRANDYEVAPVLHTIFSSKHLLDTKQFRGSLIRDGLDLYAGQIRKFHVGNFKPTNDIEGLPSRWIRYQMFAYEHALLDPPNVAGWPGHRSWINTFTLPLRKNLSASLIDGGIGDTEFGFRVNVLTETMRFRDPNDVFLLVDDLSLLCFGRPPSPETKAIMVEAVLQGAEPYDWSIYLPDSAARLRDLYNLVVRLPDYQLK